MRVFRTTQYLRNAERLLTAEERLAVEAAIIGAPDSWPVIPGTGGARKARAGRGSRGKSGGVRVIYFYRTHAAEIFFVMIYAKSAQKELTDGQKKEISRIVAEIARRG
jgi:hypothetical protein